VILFARVVLAGVLIAVAIAIDADAGASGSDCRPDVLGGTLLAGSAADALRGVSLFAGSGACCASRVSDAGAGSAGCVAGFGRLSKRKPTPKKTTIVAVATAPMVTRLSRDGASSVGAVVIERPRFNRELPTADENVADENLLTGHGNYFCRLALLTETTIVEGVRSR
jgi:hypothetical protein